MITTTAAGREHKRRDKLERKVARLMKWKKGFGGSWGVLDFPETAVSAFSPIAGDAIQEHIGALGWAVTVYTGPYPGHDGPINRCCIMRGPQDFVLGGVDVIADTRPLAICEAFVEAMERWSK